VSKVTNGKPENPAW